MPGGFALKCITIKDIGHLFALLNSAPQSRGKCALNVCYAHVASTMAPLRSCTRKRTRFQDVS